MLSIRSFLRRNALYTLYAFLFIAIPVQIGTPQNVLLPVPLPFVGVSACTGFQNAYLQVNPGVVNASYITRKNIGLMFTGTATGSTEEEIIDSTVAVLRNGEIVQEYRTYKIIYVEVVEGADTSSSGVTGQVGGVGLSMANSETKTQFPLKELCDQMAEHRPLWTEPQRSKLINAVQSAFEGKAVDNMETRVQTLVHFFPSYLLELPGQIVDDELEFLCRRTQWHIERFLSNPLPRPKDVSNLRSQVKSLILIIQDQEGDTTIVIPPALKEKATRILLETVTKVAQNPLLPALKRPLTVSELATAKADILKWLRETKVSTPITTGEDELLQWHLSRIAVVIHVVDAITRADAPQALVEMEREYLRSVRTRKRLQERFEAGHCTFLSTLSPSVETIEFMEFFFRESLALYRATFSTQFQFLIGY